MSKKEKGLVDMVNSVVVAGEGSIKGLNGNGKKIKQIKLKKKKTVILCLMEGGGMRRRKHTGDSRNIHDL